MALKVFRWLRIIDTYFVTIPGIGRVQFFYDCKYDERWAKRSEIW
jgi:hypothetical protein